MSPPTQNQSLAVNLVYHYKNTLSNILQTKFQLETSVPVQPNAIYGLNCVATETGLFF